MGSDGTLLFKGTAGAYDLRFNEGGLMTEVIHTATGASREINLKEHARMDNYVDHSARLVMGPIPLQVDVGIRSKKQGHASASVYYAKPKDLATTTKDMHMRHGLRSGEQTRRGSTRPRVCSGCSTVVEAKPPAPASSLAHSRRFPDHREASYAVGHTMYGCPPA